MYANVHIHNITYIVQKYISKFWPCETLYKNVTGNFGFLCSLTNSHFFVRNIIIFWRQVPNLCTSYVPRDILHSRDTEFNRLTPFPSVLGSDTLVKRDKQQRQWNPAPWVVDNEYVAWWREAYAKGENRRVEGSSSQSVDLSTSLEMEYICGSLNPLRDLTGLPCQLPCISDIPYDSEQQRL